MTHSPPSASSAPTWAKRTAAGEPFWRELWAHRSIFLLLARRDLKMRYAGSMLGVMWNVIHPIVMVLIYILILGTILGAKFGAEASDTYNYTIHICAGFIPWLVFLEIVTRCSTVLLENAGLIKKVAFPEIILHLVVARNAVLIHFVSYTAFILILALHGAFPGPRVFACYPLLGAVALFALGLGLIVSVLNIYFRDVGQLVSILLQFLFWFTPIVYTVGSLESATRSPVVRFVASALELNPVLHFTRLSQWMFQTPDSWFSYPRLWASLGVIALGPALTLAVGAAIFNHFKHDVLDNI